MGVDARVDALPVAGDDEERVIDADTDADHLGELRRELGHRHEVADQGDRGEPDTEPEERVHDRQAHREDRAEHDHQDDDRGEEAERERAGRLALLEVTGELGLDVRRVGGGDDVLDLVADGIGKMVSRLAAELDLGVRDRLGRRDLMTVALVERRPDGDDPRDLPELVQRLVDLRPHGGVVE